MFHEMLRCILLLLLWVINCRATEFNIDNRTRESDQLAIQLVKDIKPQIERLNETTFTIFEPISYYEYINREETDLDAILYWIKVRYDEGFMHIKIKQYLFTRPYRPAILIGYHRHVTREAQLPLFVEEVLNEDMV